MSPVRTLLSVAAVLSVFWMGPVGAASADSYAGKVLRVTDQSSYSARIMIRTKAWAKPKSTSRVRTVLRTKSTWSGGPQHLLVLNSAVIKGRTWVRVRLASRPNNAFAWIPANRARIVRNPWRVTILRSKRLVTVFRAGRPVTRFRAVVGAPDTPTPKGLSAIYEKVRQVPSNGFLGPFALHLTAHSNVLDSYGGGPGRVAIHGRDGASLADPLGTARSHGCIRVKNSRIRFLARNLPLGTPVSIR